VAPRLLILGPDVTREPVEEEEEERRMRESQHPKGALVFMLVYLLTLTVLWLNAYMRLWSE